MVLWHQCSAQDYQSERCGTRRLQTWCHGANAQSHVKIGIVTPRHQGWRHSAIKVRAGTFSGRREGSVMASGIG
ncbi:hypothetical protein L484_002630 [Morus notabilis]|uniref:Uncharacterized protein n=1 Tax=Morus notabilis TaxID=981085 RepID=W9R0T9_9ROSA|nr:hypothetical protein L484_002630 [Morus notabilis]